MARSRKQQQLFEERQARRIEAERDREIREATARLRAQFPEISEDVARRRVTAALSSYRRQP